MRRTHPKKGHPPFVIPGITSLGILCAETSAKKNDVLLLCAALSGILTLVVTRRRSNERPTVLNVFTFKELPAPLLAALYYERDC